MSDVVSIAAVMEAAPPGVTVCRHCGCAPAVDVTFHAHQGMVVAMRASAETGPFCRDCGLATCRTMSAQTLVRGWWSPISFLLTPITLIGNYAALLKTRRLAPPVSAGPAHWRPTDPGKSLLRRPQILGVLAPVVIVALAALVFYTAKHPGSPAGSTVHHAGDCVVTLNFASGFKIIQFVPCAERHDGTIVTETSPDGPCPTGSSTEVEFVPTGSGSTNTDGMRYYCVSPS